MKIFGNHSIWKCHRPRKNIILSKLFGLRNKQKHYLISFETPHAKPMANFSHSGTCLDLRFKIWLIILLCNTWMNPNPMVEVWHPNCYIVKVITTAVFKFRLMHYCGETCPVLLLPLSCLVRYSLLLSLII